MESEASSGNDHETKDRPKPRVQNGRKMAPEPVLGESDGDAAVFDKFASHGKQGSILQSSVSAKQILDE
jgi:hypothetical protein